LRQGNVNGSLVVDPSGNIYFLMAQGYGFDLVKFSPSGIQRWDLPLPGDQNGLFAWHDASGGWVAAVIARQPTTSELVTPERRIARGREPVPGRGNVEWASSTPSGGLVYDDGSYIHLLGPSGLVISASAAAVSKFGGGAGTGNSDAPGAPFSFFQPGGVVEVGSTIYVADSGPSQYGHGVDLFTTTGIYEGDASTSALGNLTAGSPLYYDTTDQALIYQNAGGIASVSVSGVHALVTSPSAPTQNGFGDTLGIGAGLSTNATAGYFPSGTTPSVTADFDPWWASYREPLELSYWVANQGQVTANALPAPTVVALSWSGVARDSPLQVKIPAPAVPGVYLVNADLTDTATATTIGSTCLTYSVGMPGDTLNFSSLVAGLDYGGPGPQRGAQLASELGTGDMREQLSMSTLLPNCVASAPTESVCGPGALTNWSNYDPATEQAMSEAKTLGVEFEVQVGQEESVDEALVSAGYWQEDIELLWSTSLRPRPISAMWKRGTSPTQAPTARRATSGRSWSRSTMPSRPPTARTARTFR
jgi:hypothetical protein